MQTRVWLAWVDQIDPLKRAHSCRHICIMQVLNLTAKGWEEASRHALRAVTTDNRMRMWLADDAASTGLLFRCARGRIALDTPVGAHLCCSSLLLEKQAAHKPICCQWKCLKPSTQLTC